MPEPHIERVRRAQRGDTAAFEALLREHFDAAYGVALGVTGDPAEAEDACQDGFVRAWQRLEQCRDPARFRGWLVSVVRSVALNRVKARDRRPSSPLPANLIDPGDPPDRHAARAELRARLTEAAAALSVGQRTALLLHDLEGFRHGEIAEIMGISEEMSRRHVSDARARMREMLPDLKERIETSHD